MLCTPVYILTMFCKILYGDFIKSEIAGLVNTLECQDIKIPALYFFNTCCSIYIFLVTAIDFCEYSVN